MKHNRKLTRKLRAKEAARELREKRNARKAEKRPNSGQYDRPVYSKPMPKNGIIINWKG